MSLGPRDAIAKEINGDDVLEIKIAERQNLTKNSKFGNKLTKIVMFQLSKSSASTRRNSLFIAFFFIFLMKKDKFLPFQPFSLHRI